MVCLGVSFKGVSFKGVYMRTERIKQFLTNITHSDLARSYCSDMEVQVNVAQDGGQRIEGEFKGRQWHGWSDGVQTWKSFRIPYNANTNPNYTDKKLNFDLAKHAEGIGMTGWNWKDKKSVWVAFDFDDLTDHSTGITFEEMKNVKDMAMDIDWVSVRRSTSGRGIHLYVYLDPPVPTKNHNEHSALARSILGKMSALTGFDFNSKVDVCGGNMWVWHRKMVNNGLELIKKGLFLVDIPPNWSDHIKVIKGKNKNTPNFIKDVDLFNTLTSQIASIPLDAHHKKLIDWLKENNTMWWWDQDHHMLVTHTHNLKIAHESLGLKGVFKTMSKGKEGNDHNCFLFPLRQGAWVVRRYTRGIMEDPLWDQDNSGWTRCFYNQLPTLQISAKCYEGVEHPKGGFIFRHSEQAMKAAELLGAYLELPNWILGRKTKLKKHKDGRLVVEIQYESTDYSDQMGGWLQEKNTWKRIFNVVGANNKQPEVGNYDDMVRHLVTETGDDYGWVIRSDNKWHNEPLQHVRAAMSSLGFKNNEVQTIVGSSIFKCWKLVNIPFKPEYPGDRKWNRNAAQLRFLPSDKDNLYYPTWLKILNHCGSGLNDAVKSNEWAKSNGVLTGADYLKCWISSLFKEPLEPLPYLFFYGPQSSGKSIFHEALSLLVTRGYQRADNALINQSGFNGELENTIICVVEEIDLKQNKTSYNRIKDWVTSRQLPIHRKQKTPYHVPNTTHWVQCSNDHNACPVFTGDTRITMSYVKELEDQIPKKEIIPLLQKEAPDFLASIMKLELPRSNDRLNVPIIETQDKQLAQDINKTLLELFISDNCHSYPGEMIKFSEFYDRFIEWVDPNYVHHWTKIKVSRQLPPQFPKGRLPKSGQFYITNMSWKPMNGSGNLPKLVIIDGKIR